MLDSGERKRRFETRNTTRKFATAEILPTSWILLFVNSSKNEQLAVIDLLRGLLKKRLAEFNIPARPTSRKIWTRLQQMFDLNELETEICLFLFVLSTYEEVQSLFEYHLKCDHFAGRNYLATILGSSSPEIGEALNGKLSKIGILDSDRHRSLSMDSGFVNLLQNTSDRRHQNRILPKS